MCQDVSRNYRWKVARIKGVHFPILIFREKNLEIRLVSQTFTSLIMMTTNYSFLCLRCLQLVAAVKQKTEDDLLKSACSKCNKMLRTTLQPHLDKTKQSPANVFKNQYLPREALLVKLTGPPETKPDVGIGTKTSRRAWNGHGNFTV